jgi:hypothetical protein
MSNQEIFKLSERISINKSKKGIDNLMLCLLKVLVNILWHHP